MAYQPKKQLTQMHEMTSPYEYVSLQICHHIAWYRCYLIHGEAKKLDYQDRDRQNGIHIKYYKENTLRV